MDKVEYDLDTSGGIMEEIQALIAPPQSDESKRKQERKETVASYRRPIRTVNRENCDACNEGGDLLCCDQCPSSFHLQCCDPPLEDDDVLTGEWVCSECKNGITKKSDYKPLTEVKASAGGVVPPSCGMSDKSSSSRSSSPVDSELEMNPFEQLTSIFRNKNPREFQLPANMQQFTVMPGDRKRRTPIQTKKKEDEAQRLCFVCTKSSRIGNLIICDFCPLVFHRDCLMPPLAQEPIGLWMCPNHPENFDPSIRTPKFSQRNQVVEELRSNINHNVIKLEFFKRAKKERILMNRPDLQPKRRRTCNVPDIVKAQYKNPPAVVVPDIIGNINRPLLPHMKPAVLPTQQEKEQWLKAVVDLQCAIAGSLEMPHPVAKATTTTATSSETSTATTPDGKASREKTDKGGKSDDKMEIDSTPTKSSPSANSKQNVATTTKTTQAAKIIVLNSTANSTSSTTTLTSAPSTTNTHASKDGPAVSNIESALTTTETTVALSVTKSLASVAMTTPKLPTVATSGSHMVSSISSEILKDPTLSQLDDRLVRILAFQRLQQLVEKKSQQTPKISQPGITEKKLHLQVTETKNAIAVLSPLNGLGPTSYMRYKSFNAGQGADMNLCLSNYGFCNYISGKHATIFYDKDSRQFELLNYSEHGTIVDNVLYSCDFSEKPKHNVTSSNAKFDTSSTYLDPQQRKRKPPIGRTTRGLGTEFITRACNCRASASSLIGGSGAGWEGTAVLHHGSYVKFGCLHFVFSIVDCASKEPVNARRTDSSIGDSKKNIASITIKKETISVGGERPK